MKYTFVLAFLVMLIMLTFSGYSIDWVISDNNLEVRFDDQTALIKVTDKRCNKVWEQTPFKEQLQIKNVNQKGNELTITITESFDFNAVLTLTEASDLEVKIQANEKLPMKEFAFPSAFKSPDTNHYLLLTNSEGILVPVNDTEYPLAESERPYYCGGGLAMAWMGVTDFQFQTGYMAILETPYDADLRTFRENGQVMFKPLWLSSLEKFGYERKVTYSFFEKGGYVAQCKKYREYIWKKNNVITLKENQKKTPVLDKMIGAVNIYVWDDAREVSFAKEMKASGIDKAFILWDANHIPYPEIGYDNQLKALGYASGVYDIFTHAYLKDTVANYKDKTDPLRFERTRYPGAFKQIIALNNIGKTYSIDEGHITCPAMMRPEIAKCIESELKEFPHEAYFLDVWAANGLFECYSPQHPLTREQFANEVIKNYKFVAEKYHQCMGGEWGADFLGSNSIFAHGMMTLQRTWWGTGIDKKGTIYYTGDWDNNASPSQMLGTRVANDAYLNYSINEYTRVPLYELVYHDAVLTSWRWEDGNHHTPELWWKKDLFNILYGTAPLWSIDRNRWNEYKQTFIESYNNICPWLQQIAYDELVSHRFISDDHKVQESLFSSGKRVIVNFGDEVFAFEGKTVKAKGYLINGI